jgi:hypothetical protein
MCETSGCFISRLYKEEGLYDGVLEGVGRAMSGVDMCCQAAKSAFSKNL